jgi:hypothetical protein
MDHAVETLREVLRKAPENVEAQRLLREATQARDRLDAGAKAGG